MVWNGSSWVVAGVENLDDLADVDTSGAIDGMVLAYDSGEWKPLSPAQLTVDVDLEYSKQTDKGIILNSAGDDATITAADTIYAGLMLPQTRSSWTALKQAQKCSYVCLWPCWRCCCH